MRSLYLCGTLLGIFVPEGFGQVRLDAEIILEWLYSETVCLLDQNEGLL